MKKTAAVIGGGFSGLTVAYRLAKAGVEVTLYEKSNSLGGLAGGLTMEDMPIEKAYHFLYKTDTHILGLAEELGLRDKVVFHRSSIVTFDHGKFYPFMTPVDLLKFSPIPFIDRIRTGVVALYLSKLTNWKPLSKVTAYEWLRKWAGKSATDVIWEPLLRGKFNKYYKDVSMSWLWRRIQIRAVSKEKGETTERLGYFQGSFMTLVGALEREIRNQGGTILLNQSIDAIRSSSDGSGATLIVDGEERHYDAIVATTPSNVFAKLIESDRYSSPEYLATLRSIDYLGAVVMVFMSEQRITEYYWHNINDPKVPFLVLLSTSELVGSEAFGGKHLYYIGAYVPDEHEYFSRDESSVMDEWKSALKYMYPEFDASKIVGEKLFRFRNAQHIVGTDYDGKIVPYESPLPNVYLSNFSQIYPDDRGTNYAVEEGGKVADLVAKAL
jgi:protoporphyrinogen oxidase